MPRAAYFAVLLIGSACACALPLYRWRYWHSAPGAVHRAPTAVAAQTNAGQHSQYGPVSVDLSQPNDAPDILSVRLPSGLSVRYLMDMPAMPGMGATAFDTQPAGRGTYSGMVIFPMAGRTRIVVQVLSHGTWQPLRVLQYNVDGRRIAHPIPSDAPVGRT